MAVRIRRIAVLSGVVVALAAGLVSAGSAGVRATANPTLYFLYSMNCTFTIQDDAGKTVTSIPPGRYQVDVRTPLAFGTLPPPPDAPKNDMTACRGAPQFQLQGPGVDLFTNMTAGCESDKVFPETFQPNASYVAQDLNQPGIAHAGFSTLAAGAPAPAPVTYGTGKGHGEVGQDIVGSLALRGTLNGTVSAAGVPTLTFNGKKVTTLKSGRYRFTIVDRSKKAAFQVLGPTAKAPVSVTGVDYAGKHTVTLRLTTGRWVFFTNLKTIHYIKVTT